VLSTATQLTALVSMHGEIAQMGGSVSALSCSLQQLRLKVDSIDNLAAGSGPDEPRGFARLHNLQHLQMAVRKWQCQRLPMG
jgi:hypothetical protein